MVALLNFGIGCVSSNPQTVKEVHQWKQDAEKGDTKAQYNLGVAYALGKGVKKNPVESEKWFLKSVEQGDGKDADAQCVLGLCYLKGMGVKEDDAEAVKLFRKAADHGYAEAQYRLGTCYLEGKGVVRDVEIAYEWFLLAKAGGGMKTPHHS